ncbi:MAG TPA: hypothetical protein VM307_02815, partial [Egibacteraceae bacterium]|nr:hypothetical protein [Egibacteraceae bacterium]
QQRHAEAAARADLAEQELIDLQQQLLDDVAAIHDKWAAVADEIDSVTISPSAANLRVVDRAVVWVPTS